MDIIDRPRRKALHDAIDQDYDTLRTLIIGGKNPTDTPALKKLRGDHHRILDTELNNPSRPDGYPSSAFGANTEHSTPSGVIPDDEQGTDTTVEKAADGRLHYRADEYKREVRNTNSFLQDAALALKAAARKINTLTTNKPDIEPDENRIKCWACARVGHVHDHARIVLINGEQKQPLCAWAYNFRVRNARVPNEDECTQHARGRRVMITAA